MAATPGEAVVALLVGAAYYAGAELAFYVGTLSYLFAPLWPPNMILLCALLRARPEAWWMYLAAALPAHIAAETRMGMPAFEWAGAFACNAALAVGGAAGLRLVVKGPPWFGSLTDAWTSILVIAIAGPAVVALTVAASAALTGDRIGTVHFAIRWFLANLSSGLTLAPMLLAWLGGGLGWVRAPPRRWGEAALVLAGLVVSAYVAFVAVTEQWHFPAYACLFIPLLLWSAVRFGTQGTSGAIFVVTLLIIYGAMHGRGPFIAATPDATVLSLQMFLAVMSAPFIILAAVIEERQRVSQQAVLAERKLQSILDNTPASIYARDSAGRYILANRRARLDANLPDDVIGKSRDDVLPEIVAAECAVSDELALRSDDPISREERVRVGDENRVFLTTTFALRDASGQVYGLCGISTDITESKRSLEALEASESRFRVMAETVPAILFTADQDGRRDYANSRFFDFTGVAQTAAGRTWSELVHPEDLGRVTAAWRRSTTAGEGFSQELRLRSADGGYHWFLARGRPIRNADSQSFRWFGAAVDVEEIKRAEQELQRTNARLSAILSGISDFYYTLDDALRVTAMNPQAAAFAKVDVPHVLGRSIFDIFPDLRGSAIDTAYRDALSKRVAAHVEFMTDACAGRWLDANIYPFDAGISVFSRDVTERKRVEQDLHELSGRLLRSQDEERRRIARELHDGAAQNIAAITLILQRLSQNLETGGDVAETHKLIDDSLAIADQSLSEMRTLSHLLHPPLLDEIGLTPAVRWYVNGFMRRSGIKVDLKIARDVGRFSSNIETALFRVVQESLGNVHRHSGSKTASIRLKRTTDEILLTISDRGGGIQPPAVGQDEIRSLGVGIAGMSARLRQLGGRLEIQPSKRGTTVKAVIPQDLT